VRWEDEEQQLTLLGTDRFDALQLGLHDAL
jgi:hypothetical protein